MIVKRKPYAFDVLLELLRANGQRLEQLRHCHRGAPLCVCMLGDSMHSRNNDKITHV